MFLIGFSTGKVVISAESRLKLSYTEEKIDKLEVEDYNSADVKEATKILIELDRNNKLFEGMQCYVKNKVLFDTCVYICLVIFCGSMNWCYIT